MNRIVRYMILLACGIIFLPQLSLAVKNEGEVDYRVAIPACASVNQSCTNNEVTLSQKYMQTVEVRNKISTGDIIAVTLQQAFIADFAEPGFLGVGSRKTTRGEIAIVANIRELDGTAKIGFSDKIVKQERLVYYSEDVRRKGAKGQKGQYLNFSALPLFGPVRFHGYPLLIELHVLELDNQENASVKSLLKKLAALGGDIAPQSAPALKILGALGSALLSGERDDSELSYYFTLYPYTSDNGSSHSYIMQGDYVVVKRDHYRKRLSGNNSAQSDIDWDGLQFIRSTGRLKKAGGTNKTDYRDHTYMTIRLAKVSHAQGMDIDLANTYYKLSEHIDDINSVSQQSTDSVIAEIDLLKKNIQVQSQYKQLMRYINMIKSDDYSVVGEKSAKNHILDVLYDEINSSPKTFTSEQLDDLLMELKVAIKTPIKAKLVTRDLFMQSQGKGSDIQKITRSIF